MRSNRSTREEGKDDVCPVVPLFSVAFYLKPGFWPEPEKDPTFTLHELQWGRYTSLHLSAQAILQKKKKSWVPHPDGQQLPGQKDLKDCLTCELSQTSLCDIMFCF